jgi:predicted metal-dependent peptidase
MYANPNDDPVIIKIQSARLRLLLNQPFWGVIALRLKMVENNEAWNKTMATDGKHMYFNRAFVEYLSDEMIQFVICHEILHCAFEHFLRVTSRNKRYWNMATDYAINWILKRDGIGEVPLLPAREGHPTLKPGQPCQPDEEGGCLLNEKYKDMNAERIYDILLESKAKQKNSLDSHIYIDELKQGDGSGDGDVVEMPSLSPEEANEVRDAMRGALIDAVQNSSNSRHAGSIPGEIARMVKEFLEPKINWRDLIACNVQSKIKSDTSFIRPSRKSTNDFILPGRIPEDTIKVACSIDVSGSISAEQCRDFLSEIKGMMSQFATFEIHLWSFDTKCNAYAIFTQDNQDEIDEWEPLGGGGTCIAENWNFMKENEIVADTFILFTDLEDTSQNSVDPDYIDTVWIIDNPYSKDIKPPFGTFARYEA